MTKLCDINRFLILVNITILELSMIKYVMMESTLPTYTSYITTWKEQSKTSTAIGTSYDKTFEGNIISTAIVQTSTCPEILYNESSTAGK